ncbi:hypothetical protein RSAG8_08323, partial [Rhizoctonia solani AG-8 WAC10335]
MAKSATAFDARPARRQTCPDDRDSQKTSELPLSSQNLISVDRPVAPRRSHSLHYGLAGAPQATTSNGSSLVEQRAREHSNSIDYATERYQSTEQIGLHEPQPHEQALHAREHAFDTNTQGLIAASLASVECQGPTTAETYVTPVLRSSQEKPSSGHLPRVKVLLYGDSGDYYSAADIRCFKAACIKGIDGGFPDNIRWFFDPDDIAPGGLLILCVTGHGIRTIHGVDIKTHKFGPKLMDTFDLHTAINKIQVPCTLEIVLGTCNSEAVISGLDRVLVMESFEGPQEAPNTLPPLNVLFKSLLPGSLVPRLNTKATLIVWAAAVDGGPAYPEADLPGRDGKNDIVIGAMCRALESATGGPSRRALFGKIREAVIEYNTARDEKHRSKTKGDQEDARVAGRYCGPQLACLLSSPGNQELILDSPAFQALRGLK